MGEKNNLIHEICGAINLCNNSSFVHKILRFWKFPLYIGNKSEIQSSPATNTKGSLQAKSWHKVTGRLHVGYCGYKQITCWLQARGSASVRYKAKKCATVHYSALKVPYGALKCTKI